jgi:ABC-type antimicrobial peptide transport system ATPase subunit
MLNTIEQKLSAIKAINEKIEEVETALQHLSLYPTHQGLKWDLLSEGTKTQILSLARADFEITKGELLTKASDLMK